MRSKRRPDEDPAEYNRVFFELLASMLHTMLSLDVSEDNTRALVARVVEVYELDEEQDATLNQLVTNFAKAVTFTQEEQVAALAEPSPDKTSPNTRGGGVKVARKRFSANYSYFTRASIFKPKTHTTGE